MHSSCLAKCKMFHNELLIARPTIGRHGDCLLARERLSDPDTSLASDVSCSTKRRMSQDEMCVVELPGKRPGILFYVRRLFVHISRVPENPARRSGVTSGLNLCFDFVCCVHGADIEILKPGTEALGKIII